MMRRFAIAVLGLLGLAACDVRFDKPLASDELVTDTEAIVGTWVFEWEDTEVVAMVQHLTDGTYRIDALTDEGLSSVGFSLVRLGDNLFVSADLASSRDYRPETGVVEQPGRGEKLYSILFLRLDGERIHLYQLDREAVRADVSRGRLADAQGNSCKSEAGAEERFVLCVVHFESESALATYFRERRSGIFLMDEPTTFERLR